VPDALIIRATNMGICSDRYVLEILPLKRTGRKRPTFSGPSIAEKCAIARGPLHFAPKRRVGE
jgi:hypothetical protein